MSSVNPAENCPHDREEYTMSCYPDGRRKFRRTRSQRRGLLGRGLLVIVAGIALLTAACGGGSANSSDPGASSSSTASAGSGASAGPGTSTTAGGSSTYQKAVAYAACMRRHGVPNFPDPLPNGGFGLGPSVTGGTNGHSSPQYQAATNACASLNPTGSLSPLRAEKILSQLLKVSSCMRAHGFKSFPDPTYSNDGVTLHIVGFDRNSPRFQSAWQTCQTEAGTGSTQR
jgi:hypothetical protein